MMKKFLTTFNPFRSKSIEYDPNPRIRRTGLVHVITFEMINTDTNYCVEEQTAFSMISVDKESLMDSEVSKSMIDRCELGNYELRITDYACELQSSVTNVKSFSK